jgi:hypothetical protein
MISAGRVRQMTQLFQIPNHDAAIGILRLIEIMERPLNISLLKGKTL